MTDVFITFFLLLMTNAMHTQGEKKFAECSALHQKKKKKVIKVVWLDKNKTRVNKNQCQLDFSNIVTTEYSFQPFKCLLRIYEGILRN